MNYYIISIVILILSMVPFFIGFEKSKPSARELTLISSLIAVAVVSRAVFYLVPQVKPIGAVVVVCGVCLGAKRGYLIGCFSAFISNFIFGQGMWTPFQMVALGLVGLLSGLIFSKIKANKITVTIAGVVLCTVVYGFIVDICSVLVISRDVTLPSIIAVYSSGVVFNLAFGISTGVFLLLFSTSFINKINRLNIKYNICGDKLNDR